MVLHDPVEALDAGRGAAGSVAEHFYADDVGVGRGAVGVAGGGAGDVRAVAVDVGEGGEGAEAVGGAAVEGEVLDVYAWCAVRW